MFFNALKSGEPSSSSVSSISDREMSVMREGRVISSSASLYANACDSMTSGTVSAPSGVARKVIRFSVLLPTE